MCKAIREKVISTKWKKSKILSRITRRKIAKNNDSYKARRTVAECTTVKTIVEKK